MSAIEKYTQDINFQRSEENITMLGLMEKTLKNMITFENLQQVNEIMIQLLVY